MAKTPKTTMIAQATGLHKATTHRILVTLLNCGFVDRTADGEKYRLGLRMIGLGLGVLNRLDLRQEALPHMEELVDRFRETCDLGVFDRGRVLDLEVVPGKYALTIAAPLAFGAIIACPSWTAVWQPT